MVHYSEGTEWDQEYLEKVGDRHEEPYLDHRQEMLSSGIRKTYVLYEHIRLTMCTIALAYPEAG